MNAPTTREGLHEALREIRLQLNHLHAPQYLRNTGRGEDAYAALLHGLAWRGTPKPSRSGGWTLGLVGEQFRCGLAEGFPILSGKRIYWKGVVAELLWFLRGETNVIPLRNEGVTIWDEWASVKGELGPVYGAQWRGVDLNSRTGLPQTAFHTDQIERLLQTLEQDPYGRRHIVTAWNPDAIGEMALPPCHSFWQVVCHPTPTGHVAVNMVLTQRSADVFLGVPFNIASYASLTHLLVAHLNRSRKEFVVGDLIINFGDLHLYSDHLEPAAQYLRQLSEIRTPARVSLELPAHTPDKPWLWQTQTLLDSLQGYDPKPAVKAKVAV